MNFMEHPKVREILKDEADLYVWYHRRPGMIFTIKRNPMLGHLNGYVMLRKSHPLFHDSFEDYKIHGGITYHETFNFSGEQLRTFFPFVEEDVRVLGFDCAHWNDMTFCKYLVEHPLEDMSELTTYRTVDFVLDQLDKLAIQINKRAARKKKKEEKKALKSPQV